MDLGLLVVGSLGLDSVLAELGELLVPVLVPGLPGLLVRGSYKLMLLSTLEPPEAPAPTPRPVPPEESSLGSYGAMVGGGELDDVAVVDETGGGVGSDGCFRDDFCSWRRGSMGPLRAIRGSTGFSTGGGGMGGGGPSNDTEAAGVGKRGGEGV